MFFERTHQPREVLPALALIVLAGVWLLLVAARMEKEANKRRQKETWDALASQPEALLTMPLPAPAR